MKHVQAGLIVGVIVFIAATLLVLLAGMMAAVVGWPAALFIVGLALTATIAAAIIDYRTEKG